ncbi:dihydrofolate reductase [Flavobacterium sp.]|uniref:dihydrofolate reductase n=1 Tax=Flavobacterium sp. TaxID=239 RepID=UPI0026085855|nr:dihydrofolate reductase [Flavobacterium sp.]
MIIMIAAVAENLALGKNNELVWHLPDDFKRFKLLTTNHYIIMGRKTFESFPRPLPNRTHIIITRQKDYSAEGCFVVDNLAEALAMVPDNENAYVIGGGEIYALALPFTDVIELTRVHADFKADTFFPQIDASDWQLVAEEYHPKDDKHLFDFTYETYRRV